MYKIREKPKNKTDEIAMYHDICYSIGKNRNTCDREMVNSLGDLEYGKTSKMTPMIRSIINKKQQLGLSVNPNEILSDELHKPRKINFTRSYFKLY